MEKMSEEEFQEWLENADPQELEVIGLGENLKKIVDIDVEDDKLYKLQKDGPLFRADKLC